jgi:LPXTG-site transpeptidase (sortase) family protein
MQILIPSLKQTIPVTPVGLASSKEVAVPSNTDYAGWYKHGVRPGQVGSAILDGHNQVLNKGKGVFGDIHKLKAGDDIYVQDDTQIAKHFVVVSNEAYDANKAPLARIFNATDKAHLNLITCTGKWNKLSRSYSQRLIVYADLVN